MCAMPEIDSYLHCLVNRLSTWLSGRARQRQWVSDQAARAGCATHSALVGVSSDHHDTSCGLPAPPGDAHNAKVHSRHLVTYYIAFPDQRKFACLHSVEAGTRLIYPTNCIWPCSLYR